MQTPRIDPPDLRVVLLAIVTLLVAGGCAAQTAISNGFSNAAWPVADTEC